MERLALCSKVLYDYDILEKQRKIVELEKRLEIPKIRFKKYEDWEMYKSRLYQDVHAILEKWFLHDPREYERTSYHGLTFRQENALNECIYEHLYNGTHNVEWSDKIASDVVYGVRAMINAMMKVFIYEMLDARDTVKLIYEYVTWYLDDDSHSPCILESLPEFTCKECNQIEQYVNEDQVCIACEAIIAS